jgi:hypothetical protein
MAKAPKAPPNRLTPFLKALQKALRQSAQQAQRLDDAFGVKVPSLKTKTPRRVLHSDS